MTTTIFWTKVLCSMKACIIMRISWKSLIGNGESGWSGGVRSELPALLCGNSLTGVAAFLNSTGWAFGNGLGSLHCPEVLCGFSILTSAVLLRCKLDGGSSGRSVASMLLSAAIFALGRSLTKWLGPCRIMFWLVSIACCQHAFAKSCLTLRKAKAL